MHRLLDPIIRQILVRRAIHIPAEHLAAAAAARRGGRRNIVQRDALREMPVNEPRHGQCRHQIAVIALSVHIMLRPLVVLAGLHGLSRQLQRSAAQLNRQADRLNRICLRIGRLAGIRHIEPNRVVDQLQHPAMRGDPMVEEHIIRRIRAAQQFCLGARRLPYRFEQSGACHHRGVAAFAARGREAVMQTIRIDE